MGRPVSDVSGHLAAYIEENAWELTQRQERVAGGKTEIPIGSLRVEMAMSVADDGYLCYQATTTVRRDGPLIRDLSYLLGEANLSKACGVFWATPEMEDAETSVAQVWFGGSIPASILVEEMRIFKELVRGMISALERVLPVVQRLTLRTSVDPSDLAEEVHKEEMDLLLSMIHAAGAMADPADAALEPDDASGSHGEGGEDEDGGDQDEGRAAAANRRRGNLVQGGRAQVTLEDAIGAFSAMSTGQQAVVLARYGHQLTVSARLAYGAPEGVAPPTLLADTNEIMHRVLDHIEKLLTGNTSRYPDDALVTIIVNEGDDQLMSAFMDAVKDQA